MTRLLTAAIVVTLIFGAAGLTTSQPAAAQPGGPSVCLNLAPGDHTFTAPARDREGEVTFSLTVGEGGVVTAFTEPGGRSVPPAAMLTIFAGDDPYPLPDGVAIIECEAGGDGMGEDGAAAELCLNLEPGSYEESVSASGQTYNITINVGQNGRLTSVEVLGQTYAPADALALLAQFGAAVPPHIQILPCEPVRGAAYPATGSGGLADSGDLTGLWIGLGSLAALAIGVAAAAQRRRVRVRNRE